MLDLDYILTTEPHAIRAVFVSDLHLSVHTPRLSVAFVKLICDLMVLPNLHSLFILGDWLDAWVGDDDYLNHPSTHWLQPVIVALDRLHCCIYVMRGNRDFMLSQRLCDCFGGQLIDEPYVWSDYRLEHGDRLCIDDTSYQRYRAFIQHPVSKKLLSALPLTVRYRLAGGIKKQSHNYKAQKPTVITDVNNQAVSQALANCTTLIHGHTHRPAVHQYHDKQRIVLGDWQEHDNTVQAAVGVLVDDEIGLYRLRVDF